MGNTCTTHPFTFGYFATNVKQKKVLKSCLGVDSPSSSSCTKYRFHLGQHSYIIGKGPPTLKLMKYTSEVMTVRLADLLVKLKCGLSG